MFSETIKRAARGERVHCVLLAELQFAAGTMYWHNEGGVLKSRGFDGEVEAMQWLGMQGRAKTSNLGGSRLGASRKVTCTLNAENSLLKEWFFESDQRAVKGRRFRFWGQFYTTDLKPIDPRFHIHTGIGDRLRMNKTGASSRQITLLLEDWFSRRRQSALEMITNSDQQQRDPKSTGFIYVQKMLDHTLNLFDARN